MMTNQEDKIISWNQIKDKVYGQEGTQRRDDLERDFNLLRSDYYCVRPERRKSLLKNSLLNWLKRKGHLSLV